jgi:thiamine biosynthesis protein ThiC
MAYARFLPNYDASFSLNEGLRPRLHRRCQGRRKFSEAKTLGELAKRARELEVQVMIEDPDTLAENTDYSGLLTGLE